MFDQLTAGGRGVRPAAAVHTVLSAFLHVAIVAGVIAMGQRVLPAATTRQLDTTLLFVLPARAAETATAPEATDEGETTPDAEEAAATPDVPSLPSIEAVDVLKVVPAVRPTPRTMAGSAVTGPAAAVLPGTGASPGVFTAAMVDDPVVPLVQPAPRYPPAMASARVSGLVVVEFVVDTVGKAEAASIRALEASHEALIESATETIIRSTFRPARSGGRPVRQLVRQRVTFSAP